MAGRALAFADPKIIKLAKEEFVAVTGDDWYQRRRQDAEGEFWRDVANQGPRKTSSTKQGVYCLTADGKLLAYRPGDVKPNYMLETLERGLAEWKKLPEKQRQPGAIKIDELDKTDPGYTRTPPKNGLILNVYTRSLDRDAKGELCKLDCKPGSGGEAARDHLWLTEKEWKSLIPANPQKGDQFPAPDAIAERVLRFHLMDNTRGEPPHWTKEQIRARDLTLTVEKADQEVVELGLQGSALLATDEDPTKANCGYDVRLRGRLTYDVRKGVLSRVDLLALGEHWGEGTYTRGARPGRTPLGIAFELVSGDAPAHRVPPQGARNLGDYLGGTP